MVSFATLALLAVAQFAVARPNSPAAFQVTNLNTFEPTGRPNQENLYHVGFTVADPSDGSSTTCDVTWDYSQATTGYPQTYVRHISLNMIETCTNHAIVGLC